MTLEMIFGVVVAIAIAFGIVSRFLPERRPKETYFRCARCNASARHTERTIEAWRQKKTKFFCPPCHKQWLESQPAQQRFAGATATNRRRSGCLGVMALLVVLPTALMAGLSVLARLGQ
jgi:hypothetical protein